MSEVNLIKEVTPEKEVEETSFQKDPFKDALWSIAEAVDAKREAPKTLANETFTVTLKNSPEGENLEDAIETEVTAEFLETSYAYAASLVEEKRWEELNKFLNESEFSSDKNFAAVRKELENFVNLNEENYETLEIDSDYIRDWYERFEHGYKDLIIAEKTNILIDKISIVEKKENEQFKTVRIPKEKLQGIEKIVMNPSTATAEYSEYMEFFNILESGGIIINKTPIFNTSKEVEAFEFKVSENNFDLDDEERKSVNQSFVSSLTMNRTTDLGIESVYKSSLYFGAPIKFGEGAGSAVYGFQGEDIVSRLGVEGGTEFNKTEEKKAEVAFVEPRIAMAIEDAEKMVEEGSLDAVPFIKTLSKDEVSELLQKGTSLDKTLKMNWNVGTIVSGLEDVAIAIKLLNDRGVMHRDIKPANILITREGFKVIDLETAGSREIDEVGNDIVGTLSYMPLNFQSIETEKNRDVYAIGVVLYELLTKGNLPFKTTSERKSLQQYARDLIGEKNSLTGEDVINNLLSDQEVKNAELFYPLIEKIFGNSVTPNIDEILEDIQNLKNKLIAEGAETTLIQEENQEVSQYGLAPTIDLEKKETTLESTIDINKDEGEPTINLKTPNGNLESTINIDPETGIEIKGDLTIDLDKGNLENTINLEREGANLENTVDLEVEEEPASELEKTINEDELANELRKNKKVLEEMTIDIDSSI